jgi:sterol desaturase/sphingolipid hydroxylase (fatty acid hydroxylase superfamily)
MSELLVEYEAPVRFVVFLFALAVLQTWEQIAPRRAWILPRARRWLANIGILVVNTVLARLVAPAAAVGIALYAEQHGIGLFHALEWPYALEVLFGAIALDLAIYLQHVMFHAVPLLWRVHRVHHADLDFDVTTGTRFHPIEILLSLAIKAAAVFIIGAPVLAVLIFEIALNATSMFNHSNIRMPKPLDRVLRTFVVTPDMHRVHHSVFRDETDRNFGFNLPWWDHLFGTYRSTPRDAHEHMTIGIPGFRNPRRCATLAGILALPFIREESPAAAARNAPAQPEPQKRYVRAEDFMHS